MNSSNNGSSTMDTTILTYIRSVGFSFIIPGVSMISLVFNTISLIVYFSRSLNSKMYRYLKAKTISDLILTAIGSVSIMANCTTCGMSQLMVFVWYKKIFLNFLNIVAYNFSGFMEVAIIYDRYLLLVMNSSHKPSVLKKLPFWKTVVVFLIMSTIRSLFSLLAYDVVPVVGKQNSYILAPNSFGQSSVYILLTGVQVLMVCVITFVPLVAFSLLFLIEFKRYISRKSSIGNVIYKLDSKQANLTRMTVILVVTYIFNRTFISFGTVSLQILTFYNKTWTVFTLINFLAYTCYYFSSTVNFFIYLKFNKNFFRAFKALAQKLIELM